ncbi:MAG: hypothetical protein CR991_10550 [Proteobacteria bacterium]|nr:MAG: hypothetical protein CR991_10550 [Pseudomonadota bacterium]
MKSILLAITLLFTILYVEISLAFPRLNFQLLTSLSSSQTEHKGTRGSVGLFDNYGYSLGPKRAFEFSHNNQLFALFQLYDEELASIKVWDVRTGELKYRTIISDFDDAAGGGYLNLNFANNDRALIHTRQLKQLTI